MTDTQIIIDEIDVTSCIYACRKLNKDGLHDCRIPNTAPFCCENIHNCYYKQLKRKEQECERLKEIANNALDKVNNYLDKKEKSLLYKQTLTEIKEIAEKRNYLDYNECLDDILQKISECEVK